MTKLNDESKSGSSSLKPETTISDEEIKKAMFEIFGADGGAQYRDAPWELLRIGTNYVLFQSLALIVKVIGVELKRGNLGVIKLLLELVEHVAKHGSVQPVVMQSFAEVLIQSLDAEKGSWTTVAVEPGSEAGSEADSASGVEAVCESESEAG